MLRITTKRFNKSNNLPAGNRRPARVDKVVRRREVASDSVWLLGNGSFPWLLTLADFLLFWLLDLAVLKETPDMGDAIMSAVSLAGELTGERNSAITRKEFSETKSINQPCAAR